MKDVLLNSIMYSCVIIVIEEIKCDFRMQKRRTKRLGRSSWIAFLLFKRKPGLQLRKEKIFLSKAIAAVHLTAHFNFHKAEPSYLPSCIRYMLSGINLLLDHGLNKELL